MYLPWRTGIVIACVVLTQALHTSETSSTGAKRKHVDTLSTQLQATTITPPEPQKSKFQHICQLSGFCALMVRYLLNQPVFTGAANWSKPRKVLRIDDLEAAMTETLHRITSRHTNKFKNLYLHTIGGRDSVCSATGASIASGLKIFADLPKDAYTFSELHEAYQKTLAHVSIGWDVVDPQNYLDILHKPEDPGDHYLLLKKSQIPCEDNLIALCMLVMKHPRDTWGCGNLWHYGSDKDKTHDNVYLWIHKTAYPKIAQALALDISAKKIAAYDEQEAKKCTSKFPLQKLPDVLLTYVSGCNTNLIMKKGELKAWRTFSLINKRCADIARPLIHRSLDAHLASTGEYELFKKLMQIYNISCVLNGKTFPSDKQLRDNLGTPHNQTQGGLFIECSHLPYKIHSPWGALELPDKSEGISDTDNNILHPFLRRVATTLHTVMIPSGFSSDRPTYYLTDISTWEPKESIYDVRKQINLSETTLPQYQGKHVFITSSLCGYHSILTIHSIDNEPVQQGTYRKYDEHRSMRLTEKLWAKLLARYKKEAVPTI